MKFRHWRFALIPCLIAALGAVSTDAAAPSPQTSAPKLDAKTAHLLRKLSDGLKNSKTIAYKVALDVKVMSHGKERDWGWNYSVNVERPNKFALFLEDPSLPRTIVSDGKHLYTYLPMVGRYTVTPAPANVSRIIRPTPVRGDNASTPLVLGFASADPYAALTDGVIEGKCLGTERVDGEMTEHLTFRHEGGLRWDMWVHDGDKPTVVRIKPDMAAPLAEAAHGSSVAKMDMTLDFSNWVVGGALPASTFQFNPPVGTAQVDSLAKTTKKKPPYALLGKAAPEFRLELLNGGRVDLARHKGHDVVVLDFWATWCPYCREAMPIVERAVAPYKGKGVALYAVNLGETDSVIRTFLRAHHLDVNVALDDTGKVAQAYRAEDLPLLVVIGKDGVVQAAHIGQPTHLGTSLKRELAELLAGKNLVAKAAR